MEWWDGRQDGRQGEEKLDTREKKKRDKRDLYDEGRTRMDYTRKRRGEGREEWEAGRFQLWLAVELKERRENTGGDFRPFSFKNFSNSFISFKI